MYNCYIHGWSHIDRPCSICNPIHTWTSSGTMVEAFVAISKSELDRLKSENARLREALEFYAQKPEPDITSIFAKSAEEWGIGSATWEPLLDLGAKARKALKGGE